MLAGTDRGSRIEFAVAMRSTSDISAHAHACFRRNVARADRVGAWKPATDPGTLRTARHTFCSWLAMAGVSLKEIQTLAGHKTITMAARYAHLSPDAAASASERMVLHDTA